MTDILLIDGDEYLFKATSVCEREVMWDEENHTLTCNEREAWDNFLRMVGQVAESYKAPDLVLCFSGKRPYFREHLAPTYKGGRVGRKPLCYAALRVRCESEYRCKSVDGIEADDVMGILATKIGPRAVIVSQDKDMETVPGRRLKGWGRAEEFYDVEHARRYHYGQALTGDKTDGYPGCPGFGSTTSTKWLSAESGAGVPWSWERVVEGYRSKDLGEEDALLQARLAKILTVSEWDAETKQPVLWTPTH